MMLQERFASAILIFIALRKGAKAQRKSTTEVTEVTEKILVIPAQARILSVIML